jgi:hypothetical protein
MAAKKTATTATPAKKTIVRRRRRVVTEEMIRERAYLISTTDGGSPLEHWLAAERELLVGT